MHRVLNKKAPSLGRELADRRTGRKYNCEGTASEASPGTDTEEATLQTAGDKQGAPTQSAAPTVKASQSLKEMHGEVRKNGQFLKTPIRKTIRKG